MTVKQNYLDYIGLTLVGNGDSEEKSLQYPKIEGARVFSITLKGIKIGDIYIRQAAKDWPHQRLTAFTNDEKITEMFKGFPEDFKVNYFWLELLQVDWKWRGRGFAMKALEVLFRHLPLNAVICGNAYEIDDVPMKDIVSFYERNNFHILTNTKGNEKGDPFFLTFVTNDGRLPVEDNPWGESFWLHPDRKLGLENEEELRDAEREKLDRVRDGLSGKEIPG